MTMTLPRSRSTDRRFYGVFEGIVTQVGDDLQEGMIKVNLPWLDSDTESEWSEPARFRTGPPTPDSSATAQGSPHLCQRRLKP